MPEPTDLQNVTTTPEPAKQEPTATAPEPKAVMFSPEQQAEMERIIKERLARKDEADKKRLEAEKQKAEADALAKNAEWEKLAKQREEELTKAKAELELKALAEKKRSIAEKVGLPPVFAGRIQGNTDEELEADAKAILDALPKDNKPKSPGPTNPGEGGLPKETDAQKYARLTGNRSSFDWMKGGGVSESNKE